MPCDDEPVKVVRRVLAALSAWVKGAPGWLGGALAGLQAALLSLACTLIPAWAIVAAAPTAPGSKGPDWGGAASVATRLWLLAFGAPWDLDGATITLAPLGLTAIAALMMAGLARRFADKTWTSWLCAVGAFSATVIAATTLTWAGAENTTQRAATAGVIAVALAAPTAAFGIWRAHGATLTWVTRIPQAVRTGARMAVIVVGVHVAAAALLGAWWALTGRSAIGDTATALQVDAVGGLALAAVETAFVPTLVVWHMAWVAGPGFDIGLAHYAPSSLTEAPLPAIPLLGGVPHAAGGLWTWAPLVVVAAGALARTGVMTRMPEGWARAGVMAIGAVTSGLIAGLLGLAASGAIGPGTLQSTGVSAGDLGLLSATLAAAGMLATEGVLWLLAVAGIGTPSRSEKRPDATARSASSPAGSAKPASPAGSAKPASPASATAPEASTGETTLVNPWTGETPRSVKDEPGPA